MPCEVKIDKSSKAGKRVIGEVVENSLVKIGKIGSVGSWVLFVVSIFNLEGYVNCWVGGSYKNC